MTEDAVLPVLDDRDWIAGVSWVRPGRVCPRFARGGSLTVEAHGPPDALTGAHLGRQPRSCTGWRVSVLGQLSQCRSLARRVPHVPCGAPWVGASACEAPLEGPEVVESGSLEQHGRILERKPWGECGRGQDSDGRGFGRGYPDVCYGRPHFVAGLLGSSSGTCIGSSPLLRPTASPRCRRRHPLPCIAVCDESLERAQ
jgi:hypothetical protein